jgi:hypothetical protein
MTRKPKAKPPTEAERFSAVCDAIRALDAGPMKTALSAAITATMLRVGKRQAEAIPRVLAG